MFSIARILFDLLRTTCFSHGSGQIRLWGSCNSAFNCFSEQFYLSNSIKEFTENKTDTGILWLFTIFGSLGKFKSRRFFLCFAAIFKGNIFSRCFRKMAEIDKQRVTSSRGLVYLFTKRLKMIFLIRKLTNLF